MGRLHESPGALPAVEFVIAHMHVAEKGRLAASVAERRLDFDQALGGNRRTYPIREFRLFADAVRRYIQETHRDEMIHRGGARTLHGLVEYLQVERKEC